MSKPPMEIEFSQTPCVVEAYSMKPPQVSAPPVVDVEEVSATINNQQPDDDIWIWNDMNFITGIVIGVYCTVVVGLIIWIMR